MRHFLSASNQKGQSVIFVLFIVSLLFFIGGAALSLSATARKTAAFAYSQAQAYYIAEAGVEKVLAESQRGPAWLKNLRAGGEYDFIANCLAGNRRYADGVLEKVSLKKISEISGVTALEIESWGSCSGSTKKVRVEVNLGYVYAENYLRGLWLKNSNVPNGHRLDLTGDSYFSDGDVYFNKGSTVEGDIYCRGRVILESDQEKPTWINGNIYTLGGVEFTGHRPAVIAGRIYVDNLNKVPDVVREIAAVLPAAELAARIPGAADFPDLLDDRKISWCRHNADYVKLPPPVDLKLDLPEGVYFLSGDQVLTGVYSGDAVLIVNGNVTLGPLRKHDESNDSLVVLSTGKIGTDSVNQEIEAFLYSKAEVNLKNGTVLKGGVLSPILSGQGNVIEIIYDQNGFERCRELLNRAVCFITITRWSE